MTTQQAVEKTKELKEKIKILVNKTFPEKEWLYMENIGYDKNGSLIVKKGKNFNECDYFVTKLLSLIDEEKEKQLKDIAKELNKLIPEKDDWGNEIDILSPFDSKKILCSRKELKALVTNSQEK